MLLSAVVTVSTCVADATAAASTLAFFFFADLDSERTSGFWIAEVAIVSYKAETEGCGDLSGIVKGMVSWVV